MVAFELKCVDSSYFGRTAKGDLSIDMSNRIIFPVSWLHYQISKGRVFVNNQTSFIGDTRKSHMLLIYIIGHIEELKQYDVMICTGTKGDYEVICFTLPKDRSLEVQNKGREGLPKIRKILIASDGFQIDPNMNTKVYRFNQDMEFYFLDHFLELSTYNEKESVKPDVDHLFKLADSCYKWVDGDKERAAVQRKERAKEKALARSSIGSEVSKKAIPPWVVTSDLPGKRKSFI